MTTPDVGTTIRFPSTSILTIDSEDRWTGYLQEFDATFAANNVSGQYNAIRDPFNFTIPNRGLLMNGSFTRIGVSEVVMPFPPNINPKTSKMNVQWNDGTPHVETIDISASQGFATPARLALVVQTAVQALSASLSGFTMVYGTNNFPVFSYATNNATTIAFTPLNPNTTAFPYSDQVKQLFSLLGFTGSNSILSTGNSGVNTYAQAVRYVDIVAPFFTQYQGVNDASSQTNTRDSLCRVYLGGFNNSLPPSDPDYAPPGTVPTIVYRNFTVPKYIQWIAKNNIPSSSLSFQVYDDAGDLLSTDTPYGVNNADNWSMTLLVSEN
jgi:hypothetical protein